MKRHLVPTLLAAASLLTAGYVIGQNKAAPTAPAAQSQQKLVKVATLNTAQANREFQANVQVMQSQRQALVELNSAMEKEKDAKKKADLKKQVDQTLAKLNENNAAMHKAYGFSITRNYVLEIERSHIYLLVSEEEAAQLEKEQQAAAKTKK